MSKRLITLLVLKATVAVCLFMSAGPAAAQAAPPALTGKITSEREGPMEGVLVSARKPGATVTVTVVSDAKGDYAFPADRLESGRYELTIRAVGYELEGSSGIELSPGKTTHADLRVKGVPVTTDQLTNSEWLTSVQNSVWVDGIRGAEVVCRLPDFTTYISRPGCPFSNNASPGAKVTTSVSLPNKPEKSSLIMVSNQSHTVRG